MPPKSISPSVTPGKRKHHKRLLEAGYSMFTPNWGDSFGVYLLGFSLFCYVFSWLSLHWIWHHPYCTLNDQGIRKKQDVTNMSSTWNLCDSPGLHHSPASKVALASTSFNCVAVAPLSEKSILRMIEDVRYIPCLAVQVSHGLTLTSINVRKGQFCSQATGLDGTTASGSGPTQNCTLESGEVPTVLSKYNCLQIIESYTKLPCQKERASNPQPTLSYHLDTEAVNQALFLRL